jgi:integrase/recombinase XerD
MSALASSLQAWFTDRLVRERNASPHTIASYRDTIRLLLAYAYQQLGVEPSRLDVDQLDAPLIGAFLDHLETHRGCSPRTRNTRLAAIRTFCRDFLLRHPEHAATIERVLQIGPKRHERALVTYLTEPELDALIDAPDRSSWTDRRDQAIIIVLAQTGLRASELTGLRCADIHLGTGAHATTTGKGRKQRITPLTKETAAVLRAWLAERRQPARRAAVPDQHRHAADPQSARPPDRQARHPRRRALLVADHQDDHAPRPAPHRRDAAIARRRRHHRDRAVAPTNPRRCTCTPTSRSKNEHSPARSHWTANPAATGRHTRFCDSSSSSLPRGAGLTDCASGEEEGTVPRQRRPGFHTSACFRRTPGVRSWRCFETFCCVKPSVSATSCGVASPARNCCTSRSRATCLRTRSRSAPRTNLPSVVARARSPWMMYGSVRECRCACTSERRGGCTFTRAAEEAHAPRERAGAGWPLVGDPLPAHAVRSATVGGSREARMAGVRPAHAPMRMAEAMPPVHASTGITMCQCFELA